MAFAAAVREIVAAHRLGIFTETARKFTDGIFHGGAPSGGLAIGDPLDRKPIHEPREHVGASSPCRHVEPQFPRHDFGNQAKCLHPHHAETVQAAELDPPVAHRANAPQHPPPATTLDAPTSLPVYVRAPCRERLGQKEWIWYG